MKIKLNVISGLLKSRPIEVSKNPHMRPMLSRARATLFDILFNIIDLENTIILDICCGSGILGIEALSRGGVMGFFFDMDKKICGELRRNLENLSLSPKAQVLETNVFIPPKNKTEPAHIAFVDLPYKSSFLIKKIFKKFYLNHWINGDTLFIIATDKKEKLIIDEVHIIREKIVSNTKLWFLKKSFTSIEGQIEKAQEAEEDD